MTVILSIMGVALLLGVTTLYLLLVTRVWRPFAGDLQANIKGLMLPFGKMEINASAIALVLTVGPTVWMALTSEGTDPNRNMTLADILGPSLLQYTIWCGAIFYSLQYRALRWRRCWGRVLQWGRTISTGFGLGLVMLLPVMVLSGLSFYLLELWGFAPGEQDFFIMFQGPNLGWGKRLAYVGLAVVVAPVAEELLFRGVLWPALLAHTTSWWRALLWQSLLFGVIHVHLSSFVPLSLAGMFFALGYAATGSLLTPVLMHVAFNACSITLFLCLT